MPSSYSGLALLAVVVAIGALTFAIRFSFIALVDRLDALPAGVMRALRFVPPAVLAALVLPAVLQPAPGTGGVAAEKLVAGGVAAAVAWRTESVLATLATGMGTLWAIRFLL